MDTVRSFSAKLPRPGLVVVLAHDQLSLFEFSIAAEIFGLPRPEISNKWYDFAIAGVDRRIRTRIGGLPIRVEGGLDLLEDARTVIVPGWKGIDVMPDRRLVDALWQMSDKGGRVVSICTGAFLLGHVGLLRSREATTHWMHAERFRDLFPDTRLLPDMLYVESGNIITSAGSAAGIDACLHLVRKDFGSRIANQVAQRLVMPPHREGGQRQFIPAPVALRPVGRMSEIMEWARERLPMKVTVRDMAREATMSERNFHRRFKEAVGMPPATWLASQRIAQARELLEKSDDNLEQISDAVGFRSAGTFRIAFRRQMGLPPMTYRRRFRSRQSGQST